ncbi:hypothetical protein uav_143 [Pseudomonas phage UAVern]|uniref:Uncharacterized protein n=1 Tax=Pseudomonas phage UAVern TaxID=2856997 RepID=A0A975YYR1_9CAUD|nr:hypothetical protein uav_143 [Pseudomonas phage UAVern]
MFKRTALIALAAAVIGYAALPQHAEAAGYKSSSRSSGFSSSRSSSISRSSSSSYYRPKAVAPSRPAATPYSRPSAQTRQSYDSARQRPVTTPIRRPTASTPYAGQSAGTGYRRPVTPYGSYRAPTRQVSSPLSRSSRPSYAPRNTTIINRNYYGGGSNFGSYGRGHYGGGYGGGMMGGGGPGLGSMLLAGAGGAIVGNMLYNSFSHTPSAAATTRTTDTVLPASEVAQIQQEQRIEDKLDQVNDKLDAFPAGPQGYSLPPDAPLMMSPSFYQLGGGL